MVPHPMEASPLASTAWSLFWQAESIRDVIAFPKTQKGQDLMTDSPGTATDRQLKDLKIKSIAEDT